MARLGESWQRAARSGKARQGAPPLRGRGFLFASCAAHASVNHDEMVTQAPYQQQPKESPNAKTSLTLGAISMLCCGPVAGVPAIVFGVLGRSEIERSNGALTGKDKAAWGIVLGSVGTCLWAGLMIIGALNPKPNQGPIEGLDYPSPKRDERAAHKESSAFGKAEVSCTVNSPVSLSCQVRSVGAGKAKLCWDSVVVCDGTRHVSHDCSSLMDPGSVETRVARNFSPPIDPSSTCDAIMAENAKLE